MTNDSDSDLFRAYTVSHEAWYASAITREHDEILVCLASTGGGVRWEFVIRQVEEIGVQLRMFSDSWSAFTDVPDFFNALIEMGDDATLPLVRDALSRLGFRDITERERVTR